VSASAKKTGVPAAIAEANADECATAALAPQVGDDQHDSEQVNGARGPPRRRSKRSRVLEATYIRRAKALKKLNLPGQRLLSKPEVMAITGVSFPSLWAWMRKGAFPRSRVMQGKSMWLQSEIESWIASLPVRPLKGDASDS
jgi:predicted DNA-binding transcriptional regulator AlpA